MLEALTEAGEASPVRKISPVFPVNSLMCFRVWMCWNKSTPDTFVFCSFSCRRVNTCFFSDAFFILQAFTHTYSLSSFILNPFFDFSLCLVLTQQSLFCVVFSQLVCLPASKSTETSGVGWIKDDSREDGFSEMIFRLKWPLFTLTLVQLFRMLKNSYWMSI